MLEPIPTTYTFSTKYGPCNRTPTGVCTFCTVIHKHYQTVLPLDKHKTIKWKQPTSIMACQIGTDCLESIDCFTDNCNHRVKDVKTLLSLGLNTNLFSFTGNIMIQES